MQLPAQYLVDSADSVAAVAKLPTELLRQIFLSVVSDCKTSTDITPFFYTITVDMLSPLKLTHICRRWREVATDMPELWTAVASCVGRRIVGNQTNDILSLFLARARGHPLSALIANDLHAANKLCPHMDHIRTLEIVGYPALYTLDILARPAPALEYLILACPPPPDAISFAPIIQAPIIFRENAPSLQALVLLNMSQLPTQSFPVLTDLHVGMQTRPRFEHLLQLLEGTPALESLAVVNYNAREIWNIPDLTIQLSRLRRLALIRMPMHLAMIFLLRLTIPASTTLYVLDISEGIGFPVEIPQTPPISAADMLEMVVCGSTLSFHLRASAQDLAPRVRFEARRDPFSWRWWKSSYQSLPCANLTELRVALEADNDTFLPPFLDAAVALSTLELRLYVPAVTERSGSGIAGARFDGAPQAWVGVCALLEQAMPVVCPRLAEVALIDAASSECAWDGFVAGSEEAPRVAYVPDVLCVVAARAAAGRALRRIAIQGRWRPAQRERVSRAFAMGAVVTDFEFRELDADAPALFEFEDHSVAEVWENGYWRHELPKHTLPWRDVKT
ncbi:hypothetical protein BD311DRAFT_869695 [Dichomitus squalens]|uniref:Uncharacterized protein n=1 Tax=Dichomitus squalens TaxID=114155 RepID=A0A4Q9M8F2_9APHY|nr:hypothetical protein BD311DRAFT_869695 [Dichomitus squalens]